MSTECLTRASDAYLAPRQNEEQAVAVVRELAGYEVFSNRNLQAITGLNEHFIGTLTEKRTKTGGRLNPVTLPLMVRLADDWNAGVRNEHVARTVVELGTSIGMIAKLCGIPYKAVAWLVR